MGSPRTGEIYEGMLRDPHDVELNQAKAAFLREIPERARLLELQAMATQARTSGVCREMPRYKCHKEVYALKIAEIQPMYAEPTAADLRAAMDPQSEAPERMIGGYILVPADEGFAPFDVGIDYVNKHKPEAGGYYVSYDDGYKSYSPAKAFEEGYTRI